MSKTTPHREKDKFRKGYLVLVILHFLPTPAFLWKNFDPPFLENFENFDLHPMGGPTMQ